MEKEGLYRVMQFLQQQDLTIEVLVTDRHRQIAKWLRESYPEITHYYDVWHLAKGMKHSSLLEVFIYIFLHMQAFERNWRLLQSRKIAS